jgi:hypothetical protein
LVSLGSLGLAGLAPPSLPALAVAVTIVGPLALFELGAAVRETARRARGRRVAEWLERGGAALYLVLCGGFLLHASHRSDPLLIFLAALGALGLWPSVAVLRGALGAGGAEEPRDPPDPAAAGARLAAGRGRLAEVAAVLGPMNLLLAGVCLAFVVAALAIALRPGPTPPKIGLGGAFFGAGALLMASGALARWIAHVPGSRLRLLLTPLRVLGFAGFGGSFVALAFVEDDELGLGLRLVFGAFGALSVAAGLALAGRSVLGLRPRHELMVAREGLLERTRRATILYPWAALRGAWLGELHGNLGLFVAVDHAMPGAVRLLATRGDAARSEARLRRRLASNERWVGAAVFALDLHLSGAAGAHHRLLEAGLASAEARAALPTADDLLGR